MSRTIIRRAENGYPGLVHRNGGEALIEFTGTPKSKGKAGSPDSSPEKLKTRQAQ
jgi:hypothetical protein